MEWWGDTMIISANCKCEKDLNELKARLDKLIVVLGQSFEEDISQWKYGSWSWYRPRLVTRKEMQKVMQALYDHLDVQCVEEESIPSRLVISKRKKGKK